MGGEAVRLKEEQFFFEDDMSVLDAALRMHNVMESCDRRLD